MDWHLTIRLLVVAVAVVSMFGPALKPWHRG